MVDRAFTTLLPKISSSTPGCPQPLLIQYIRDAAINACERTLIWRYVEPKFNLTPGVSEYAYNKPDESDVHVIFDALVNNQPLDKLTLEQAIALYPAWADLYSGVEPSTMWDSAKSIYNTNVYNSFVLNEGSTFTLSDAALADASEPRAVCQITPNKYIILPLPDNQKTYSMRMFYALKPKRTATGMDSNIFDELEDVITHAALQQLLVMPNVAWTDRDLASYHAKQYLFAASERRSRANLGNMRGAVTARSPKFA